MAVIYTHIGPKVKAPSVSWIFQNLPAAEVAQIVNVNLTEQQDVLDIRQLSQARFPIDLDSISDSLFMSSHRFVADRQDVSDIRRLIHGLEIGERFDVVDEMRKILGLDVFESQASSDSAVKAFSLFRSEQQDVADISAKIFAKALTDTLVISDTAQVARIIAILFTDIEDMTDGIRKLLGLGLPDNQAAADSTARIFSRLLEPDQQHVSDLAMYVRAISVSVSDSVDVVDVMRKLLNIGRVEQQDGSDSTAKTFFKFPIEDEAISDAVGRMFIKAIADTQDISDIATIVRLLNSLTDIQVVADGIRKSLQLGLADSEAAFDVAARIFTRFLNQDREDMSDISNYNRVLSASVSDAVAVVDVIKKLLIANRGEQQDASDVAIKAFLKFLTDDQAVSDATTISLIRASLSISLTDTEHISDGIMKSLQVGRTDDQATSDATSRLFSRFISTDNQAASDAVAYIRLLSLLLSDREDFADGIRKLFNLQPFESAVVSDATTKLFVKVLTESQAVSDVPGLHRIVGMGLSDSVVVNDILAKVFFKNIGDREDVEETIRKTIYANLFDIRQDVSEALSVTIVLGTPLPAAVFVEYAVSSVVDSMRRAVGNTDLAKRRETIADSLRRIVGEKIGKRK